MTSLKLMPTNIADECEKKLKQREEVQVLPTTMADPALVSLLMRMNANLLQLNTSVLNLHAKVDRLDGDVSSLKSDFIQFRAEVRQFAKQS